jgi:hypothetical protein
MYGQWADKKGPDYMECEGTWEAYITCPIILIPHFTFPNQIPLHKIKVHSDLLLRTLVLSPLTPS